jgi:hypothetical protein
LGDSLLDFYFHCDAFSSRCRKFNRNQTNAFHFIHTHTSSTINQSIHQSIHQSTNQSINQSSMERVDELKSNIASCLALIKEMRMNNFNAISSNVPAGHPLDEANNSNSSIATSTAAMESGTALIAGTSSKPAGHEGWKGSEGGGGIGNGSNANAELENVDSLKAKVS